MSNGPTPEQIAQVQQNLKNMQAFNDYVYTQGQSRVLNAYWLLSEQDNSDPGLTVGLNILEGAFWAIGSELGPIGNFAASFLSGMVSWWASNTPSSLNSAFASLVLRLQATSLAVDTQLATYYTDVPGNWNTQFTYNGRTAVLSDFASGSFPAETDPTFETLAGTALFALDQQIWTQILTKKFVVTLWELSSGPTVLPGKESEPPVSWDEGFIAANPAYYNTWTWQHESGCGAQSGWLINEYNLGTGAGVFSDGSISHDACNYLFIDSADGVVINAAGLYPRATVFNNLGIKQKTYTVAVPPGPPATKVSAGYLRAMKEGRTIGQLVEREGRDDVQRRIVERARQDSVFALNLAKRPRQTIESFLGVRIPEIISVSAIVETPRSFTVVVPHATPGTGQG